MGILFVLFGNTLRIVSAHTLGYHYDELITVFRNHRVVRRGIYGLIRHPLHKALMLELSGFTLIVNHYIAVGLLALCILVFFWRNIQEEEFLLQIFGDEYRLYLHGVHSIVDFIPNWVRLLAVDFIPSRVQPLARKLFDDLGSIAEPRSRGRDGNTS